MKSESRALPTRRKAARGSINQHHAGMVSPPCTSEVRQWGRRRSRHSRDALSLWRQCAAIGPADPNIRQVPVASAAWLGGENLW